MPLQSRKNTNQFSQLSTTSQTQFTNSKASNYQGGMQPGQTQHQSIEESGMTANQMHMLASLLQAQNNFMHQQQ